MTSKNLHSYISWIHSCHNFSQEDDVAIVTVHTVWTWKLEFPNSQAEISTGTPPELRFLTRKVRRTSPTQTSKSNMAAPCINICESCSNVLFISTSVLFVSHYTQWAYCPTSVCGHVATEFVCTKYRVMCCYQLVLLMMAKANPTPPPLGFDVIPISNFQVPR